MKITLYPEDIIKRGCWDSYVYYVIGTESEAKEILEKNEEMVLSERDALVIGLLKVIETDNLIHKFNTYIVELLTNKSMKKTKLMIRKNTFDNAVKKFSKKFPDYWNPSKRWKDSLEELEKYIQQITEQVDKLEVHKIVDKNITIELYSSGQIKKLLKFNY